MGSGRPPRDYSPALNHRGTLLSPGLDGGGGDPMVNSMNKISSILLVALFLAGCGGEEPSQENGIGGKVDLDDNETRQKIIAEALEVDPKTMPREVMEGKEIFKAPKQKTPYTGWAKMMDDNGHVRALMQFKDGKPNGLGVGFHPNGAKASESSWRDGKREGLMTQWYASGQKQTEINFKDGNEHGLITEWHENGQKRWEANWKNGVQDGLDTTWRENGEKERETVFKDGNEMSRKSWDEDGKLRELDSF